MLGGAADRSNRELRAERRVDAVAAGHVHDLARPAQLPGLLHAVRNDRGNAPGAIGEPQPQMLVAKLETTHKQRLCDFTSVYKLADFHRMAKIEWPADGS